jgi:hypothetical protein
VRSYNWNVKRLAEVYPQLGKFLDLICRIEEARFNEAEMAYILNLAREGLDLDNAIERVRARRARGDLALEVERAQLRAATIPPWARPKHRAAVRPFCGPCGIHHDPPLHEV